MKKVLKRIIEISFYIFVFLFIFQTKFILFPAEANYNEIAIYFNYLLVLFIAILTGFYFWYYQRKDIKAKVSFDRFFVALAAWEFFIFLSIFVSVSAPISIFKYITFLLAVSLFFVMHFFKFNYKKVVYIFLVAMLFQFFLGYYQFVNQETIVNKYLGLATHEVSTLGTAVLENSGGRILRSYGATDHPNIFGSLMFFAIILTIFLILDNEFSLSKKMGHYFALSLFSLGLVFSFSRSAFLALFLSLFFLLVFFYFKKEKLKIKKYLAILLFLFSIFLILFFIYKPLISDRFNFSSRLEKISLSERQNQLSSAKELILSNPWLGVGAGAYHQKLLNLNPQLKSYEAQPVHNVFALIWAEIGLWGFICFVLFLIFVFIKKANLYQTYPIFIGLFVFMSLDHWLFSLPFGLLFLFFIISLTFKFEDDKVIH